MATKLRWFVQRLTNKDSNLFVFNQTFKAVINQKKYKVILFFFYYYYQTKRYQNKVVIIFRFTAVILVIKPFRFRIFDI